MRIALPACAPFWGISFIIVFVAGCQTGLVPTVDAESAAAFAAGSTGDAIAFSTVGAGDDVPSAPSGALALRDAIGIALRSSPQLQSALAKVRIAEADARQTRLLPNPILSVVFRFSTQNGTPNIDAGLSQELIAILQQPGRARVADARLRAAAVDAVSSALDIVAEVQERFTAIESLDGLIRVLGERRKLVDRLTDVAKAKLDAGEGTRLDVLTLQAQRLELDSDVADRELERRAQRLTLARLLGQPSGAADWVLTPSTAPGQAAPESQWIAIALERRPELQAKQWEITAREGEWNQTRLMPFEGTSVGAAAERDGDWSAGPSIEMPLPLFDMGQARQARAMAALTEARHDLTSVRRTVIEEVRQAHSSLSLSQANLSRVRDSLVPVQEQRLAQAEAQYRTGQTDITSLFVVEQDLRSARAKQVELERKTSEALIRLQRAVGGPGAASEAKLISPLPATNPAPPAPKP